MRLLRTALLCLPVAGGVFGPTSEAHAGEVTRVASSFEEDDRFDIHFGVAYAFSFKRAAILREWNRGTADDDQTRLVKDLIYRQQRHTLTPVVEVGVWHDLSVYLEIPIIVADARDWAFDQRADDCTFGDSVSPEANCVNKDNSTTLRDEIIPRDGMDATDTSNPFGQFTGAGTEQIFKGPVRRGVDQLHVGIKYGILNQSKRSHMPNWIIAAEGRFGVGRAMTFSRNITIDEPTGNRRIGRRIHELGFWTALSRRYRFLDPFFTAYWRGALRASNSRFQDFSSDGSQDRIGPQSRAGMSFGAEIVPWERKAKNLKVAIVAAGSADLHYAGRNGGRGYSEIWELLADSPSLVGSYEPVTQALDDSGNPTSSRFCDRNAALAFARGRPGDPGYIDAGGSSCQKFEGLTDIQDYGTFGFRGGLNLTLGQYARLMTGVNVSTDTRHFITFANRGDANADPNGDDDDRVEEGTVEVNPVRRNVVDNIGRRYLVDDVLDLHVYLRFLVTF